MSESRLSQLIQNSPRVAAQRESINRLFGHTVQRKDQEAGSSRVATEAEFISGMTRRAAARRLRGADAGLHIMTQLGPRQGAVRQVAREFSAKTRRELIFVHGVCYWDFHTTRTWAEQNLSSSDYALCEPMYYALAAFDELRAGTLTTTQFLNKHVKVISCLPLAYKTLLSGYLQQLPQGNEQKKWQQELSAQAEGDAIDKTEARHKADTDRMLHTLAAAVRSQGISTGAGMVVASALARPEVFKAASRRQLVEFVACAYAAGVQQVADQIVAHARPEDQGEIHEHARAIKWFHWDVHNWALANIRGGGLISARKNMEILRRKPYWGKGKAVPRYAAIQDRAEIVYAIQETLQRTPPLSSSETSKKKAAQDLRQIRKELYNEASNRDAIELNAAASSAIIKTPLPKVSMSQLYLAELAGSVGIDPKHGRSAGKLVDKQLAKVTELQKVLDFLKPVGDGIGKILANPAVFANTMVKAVTEGFKGFFKNLRKYLVSGLTGFLFGTLRKAGGNVQLPKDLSLKSILGFVLELVGLTPARIRARLVKMLSKGGRDGEAWLRRIEMSFDLVSKLIGGGISGLTATVAGYMTNAKEMLITAAIGWAFDLGTRLLAKLATWLVPGAGWIMAIFNVIQTLVERARQITTLVSAVVGSLAPMAEGKWKKAAARVEAALGAVVPVTLGFAAGLVGLGKIVKSIAKFFNDLGKKAQKKIDQLLARIVEKALGLLGRGGKKTGKKTTASSPVVAKVEIAVAERTRKPFKDLKEAQAMISDVHDRFRSMGLKSLKMKRRKQGLYDVLAKASPVRKVGNLLVNDDGLALFSSEKERKDEENKLKKKDPSLVFRKGAATFGVEIESGYPDGRPIITLPDVPTRQQFFAEAQHFEQYLKFRRHFPENTPKETYDLMMRWHKQGLVEVGEKEMLGKYMDAHPEKFTDADRARFKERQEQYKKTMVKANDLNVAISELKRIAQPGDFALYESVMRPGATEVPGDWKDRLARLRAHAVTLNLRGEEALLNKLGTVEIVCNLPRNKQ